MIVIRRDESGKEVSRERVSLNEDSKRDVELDVFIDMLSDFTPFSLTKKQLDEAYRDYSEDYDTMLTGVYTWELDESEVSKYDHSKPSGNKVTPAKDVIKSLKNHYRITDCQFKVKKPNFVEYFEVDFGLPSFMPLKCAMLIPEIGNNRNIIDREMSHNNYHVANEIIYMDEYGRYWYRLIYDPNYQESITEQIRKNKSFLYHSSPVDNYDSIAENGIVPKNERRVYDFGEDRLYLYAGDPKSDEYHEMMTGISNNRKRRDKKFTGDFTLYYIKVSKIPNDVEFYYDAHSKSPDFVFTKSPIPYSAIFDEEVVSYD